MAKLQYAALRLPFALLEDFLIARYWGEDAPARVAFERWLSSLDVFAGRLLADDELIRRGQALRRQTKAPKLGADDQKQYGSQQPQQAADELVATGNGSATTGEAPVSDADWVAGPAGAPDTGAAGPGTVAVTFILPAEVQADTVALCGEFNDWSAEATHLERRSDGSWRATVALEPGRSYRYRYLLDGQRWENDSRADRYAPNDEGSMDSVIVVE
jgi:hypothetical protein